MPRFQVVIEFWAYSENRAGHAVGAARDAIHQMTVDESGNAESEGIACGSVEVVSVNNVQPVSSQAWPGIPQATVDW